jgi:copper(I)-binding protein
VLLATVAGTTLLVGCGAGQEAQTAGNEPSVPGVSADLRGIAVRNVQIEYPDREARTYPKGGSAPLEVRIFNTGTEADALVQAESEAAEHVVLVNSGGEGSDVCPRATVSLPAAEPTLRPDRATRPARTAPGISPSGTAEPSPTIPAPSRPAGNAEFAVELAPGSCALLVTGRYRLELSGLRQELAPGDVVPVTFSFREAGEVTLQVPFGLPTDGAEHSPEDIHPVEPPAVDGRDTDGGHE